MPVMTRGLEQKKILENLRKFTNLFPSSLQKNKDFKNLS
jgi:hypothetical protein